MANNLHTALFGGGCFWCTEAVFSELQGVQSVVPGYAGGETHRPTYAEVSRGRSGHAEVIRVTYDPSQISYQDLLAVFFSTHNPTTPNRQGNDVGPQYRSVIFYTSDEQRQEAEAFMQALRDADPHGPALVTELKPLERFWEAEGYHHRYYEKNPDQAYCQIVISPRLAKLRAKYAKFLKTP